MYIPQKNKRCKKCNRLFNPKQDSDICKICAEKPMGKKEQRKAQQSTRICLRCDKPFLSDGIFNRICPNCRESNANISPLGAMFEHEPISDRTLPKASHEK